MKGCRCRCCVLEFGWMILDRSFSLVSAERAQEKNSDWNSSSVVFVTVTTWIHPHTDGLGLALTSIKAEPHLPWGRRPLLSCSWWSWWHRWQNHRPPQPESSEERSLTAQSTLQCLGCQRSEGRHQLTNCLMINPPSQKNNRKHQSTAHEIKT